MTSIQILFFFLVFLAHSSRSLAVKNVAKHLGANLAPLISAIWFLLGVLFLYPFYKDLLILDKIFQPIILLSVFKSVVLWLFFDFQQKVMRKSVSSGVFFMPIALGIGAIVNSFFGEDLSGMAWLSIIALFILGVIFFTFGHAKELDYKHKLYFLGLIFCFLYFIVVNHIVISASNWFIHFTITGISFFALSFLMRTSKLEWKEAFCLRSLIVGLIIMITEIIYCYSMINVMPVSIATLASVFSVPFVMVNSALFYKEKGLKEQLLFGGLAYAFCVPLLLSC